VRAARVLWIAFSLFILYGSTFPFRFTTDAEFVTAKFSRVSLNPLISPDTGHRISLPDAAQNVLLFVPFGILGWLSTRGDGGPRRLLCVVFLACGLSALVEAIQLFTLDRTTSLADVIANGVGASLGVVVARYGPYSSVWELRLAVAWRSPYAYPLIVALVGLVAASSQPFDVTLDVSAWLGKLHALQHDPWQFVALDDEGVAIVQNALFAFALCAWSRRLLPAAAASVVLALALEASQVAIQSRQPGLEDALVRAAGALAGACTWAIWRPLAARGARPATLVALLVAAMAAGATIQALSPFSLAPSYQAPQWLPPVSDPSASVVERISGAIAWSLTYLPIGFCLTFVARRSRARAVLLISAIALTLELAQGWIVGRAPSALSLAASVAGGWIGAWAGRFGGGSGSE
jgi:VanZ family protein